MQFDQFNVRLLNPQDLNPYYNMVDKNRKRLEDFFTGTVSRTATIEDTATFLEELMLRLENKSYYPYVIIDENSNTFAGFIDVKNIDWTIPKAEIGFYMDEDYAGQGLCKKALRLIMARLFNELNFHKLFLRTHPSNEAARKLAESCGFQIEGTIRQDYKTTKGDLVDLIYYGKLRSELES